MVVHKQGWCVIRSAKMVVLVTQVAELVSVLLGTTAVTALVRWYASASWNMLC